MDVKILEDLTGIIGVSGCEENVSAYISKAIEPYCDGLFTDSMGNLTAYKKGNRSGLKVMVAAHMDEIGFIVTAINDKGLLKFENVGGIDDRILPGKMVLVGKNQVPGVIGIKAIHLQSPEEFAAVTKINKLTIDIGAKGREEALKHVKPGDMVTFKSDFEIYGKDNVKAKALDDRIGCYIAMEILKGKHDFDLFVCFTVQEEVGLRGATVAAYRIKPHIALALEGTTCSDVFNTKDHEHSTRLGKGAVVSIIDGSSYSDKNLVKYILKTAGKNQIPVQIKETVTGGNDAGAIQRTGVGVKTAVISVPVRYIHSPSGIASIKDVESAIKLTKKTLEGIRANIEEIGGVYDD